MQNLFHLRGENVPKSGYDSMDCSPKEIWHVCGLSRIGILYSNAADTIQHKLCGSPNNYQAVM